MGFSNPRAWSRSPRCSASPRSMRSARTSCIARIRTLLTRRRPNMAKQNFRRIATEEAFATAEQFDALRELVANTREYDPDVFLADRQIGGSVWTRRLLDLEGERLEIMDAS